MGAFKAGTFKISITPHKSVNLAGFTRSQNFFLTLFERRKSQGTHDEIMAKSLALFDGERYLVLCAVDVIGLVYDDVAAIKDVIYQKVDLRPLDVIICATHTHGGPDTYGRYGGIPDWYQKFLIENTATAGVEALQRLQPAALGFASTQIESLTQNVRSSHAPTDREASILVVQQAGPSPNVIATLVNFPCRPNIVGRRNRMVTGDFPMYVTKRLEEHLGGMAMYTNGAQADIYPAEALWDPKQKKGLRTFAQAEAFGFKLAQSILQAIARVQPQSQGTIQIAKKEFYIPIRNRRVYLFKALGVLKRELYDNKVKTETYAVRINNGEIVTLPGQAFSKLGRYLKSKMRSEFKFVFGLANDEIAYIVPPEDFDKSRGRAEEIYTLGIETWDAIKENTPKLP